MTIRITKLLLTSHVSVSVGWLGAVGSFVAIAAACVTAANPETGRALYPALELIAWYVVLPFCFASLLTGILQAVVTPWGLFRHYWIIVKLILTVAMTVLLILHLPPISYLSSLTSDSYAGKAKETAILVDLIAKAGAAITALLAITALSIYKPWGAIQQNANPRCSPARNRDKKTVGFYLLIILASLIVIGIIKHLSGGAMGMH
jgi:hypothetical protein